MEVVKITKESEDLPLFDRLITDSFPPDERVLPSVIVDYPGALLYAVYDGDAPLGILDVVTGADCAYGANFAIFPQYRGRGAGKEAIKFFLSEYPDKLVIAEIEKPDGASDNNDQRIARHRFYDRLGFHTFDFDVNVLGCDFLTLAFGSGADDRDVVAEKYVSFVIPLLLYAYTKTGIFGDNPRELGFDGKKYRYEDIFPDAAPDTDNAR